MQIAKANCDGPDPPYPQLNPSGLWLQTSRLGPGYNSSPLTHTRLEFHSPLTLITSVFISVLLFAFNLPGTGTFTSPRLISRAPRREEKASGLPRPSPLAPNAAFCAVRSFNGDISQAPGPRRVNARFQLADTSLSLAAGPPSGPQILTDRITPFPATSGISTPQDSRVLSETVDP